MGKKKARSFEENDLLGLESNFDSGDFLEGDAGGAINLSGLDFYTQEERERMAEDYGEVPINPHKRPQVIRHFSDNRARVGIERRVIGNPSARSVPNLDDLEKPEFHRKREGKKKGKKEKRYEGRAEGYSQHLRALSDEVVLKAREVLARPRYSTVNYGHMPKIIILEALRQIRREVPELPLEVMEPHYSSRKSGFLYHIYLDFRKAVRERFDKIGEGRIVTGSKKEGDVPFR